MSDVLSHDSTFSELMEKFFNPDARKDAQALWIAWFHAQGFIISREGKLEKCEGFEPVKVYSNWCYYDRIEDKDIEDGEPLELRFPDGTTQIHNAVVKEGGVSYNDHGHGGTAPTKQAFIYLEAKCDGVKDSFTVPLRLYKSGILARRPK